MPKISRFYGIEISIFLEDHPPPHFHARYAEYEAQVRISDGEIMRGRLPPRAAKLVRLWTRRYNVAILRCWQSVQEFGIVERVPPME